MGDGNEVMDVMVQASTMKMLTGTQGGDERGVERDEEVVRGSRD